MKCCTFSPWARTIFHATSWNQGGHAFFESPTSIVYENDGGPFLKRSSIRFLVAIVTTWVMLGSPYPQAILNRKTSITLYRIKIQL